MPRQINLLQKIGSLFRGTPKVPALPARKPVGEGHRGIAAGDLAERHARMARGETPYSEEEVQRWHRLPGKQAEDFVYGGQPLYVHSSNVADAVYHIDTQSLDVGFLNGSLYRYENVSIDEAIEFTQVQSKGKFVHDTLKGKSKPFKRIR